MDQSNTHHLILGKIPLSVVESKITPNSLVSTFHVFKKGVQKNFTLIHNQLLHLNLTGVSCSPILSFKKEPIKRTYQDIFNIKHFIDSSDFGRRFKDKVIPQESMNKMVMLCAIEMRYSSIKENEIVFRIGDPGKDFYLVLSGLVDVLKPEMKRVSMTGFEYFEHLMSLRKENEMFVYNKTIKENIKSYFIDDIDRDIINQITFINFLTEVTQRRRFVAIEDITELCMIDLTPIPKLKLKQLHEQQGNFESIVIIKDFFALSDSNLLRRYDYFINDFERKEVEVYEYKSLVSLKSGFGFGDAALDKKTGRNATIKAMSFTEFAVLDGQIYYSMLSKEKTLLTNREINFLHKNFFFVDLPYRAFDRKYYNLFVLEERIKGDYLCVEDEEVNKIFFIRKGTVSLFTNKSILETHLLLNVMHSKRPEIKDDNSYFPAKNNINDMKKQLNEKRTRKVFSYDSNDIIGLEAFAINMPYMVSAIVTSETATVFKIDIRHFRELCLEPRVKEGLALFSLEKLGIIYRRLYEMNKILIKKIDDKKSDLYSNSNANANDAFNSQDTTEIKAKEGIRKRNSMTSLSCLNNTSFIFNSNGSKGLFNKRKTIGRSEKVSKSITCKSTVCSVFPRLKDMSDPTDQKKTKIVLCDRTYESSFLNQMKRDIALYESKIVISMNQDTPVIVPPSDNQIGCFGFSLKSNRSCSDINAKGNSDYKKLNALLQSKEQTNKRNILITQMQNHYSVELDLNEEGKRTKLASRKTRLAHPYINPSVQEKKNKYAVFNLNQNNIKLNSVNMSIRTLSPLKEEGRYLFPKGKVQSNLRIKKSIEYKIHKKLLESKINSSLRYNS